MYSIKIAPKFQKMSSILLLNTFLDITTMSEGILKEQYSYSLQPDKSMYQNVIVKPFDISTDLIQLQWDFCEQWQKDGQLFTYAVLTFIDKIHITFSPNVLCTECYITPPIYTDVEFNNNNDFFHIDARLVGYTELYPTQKTIITSMQGFSPDTSLPQIPNTCINLFQNLPAETERIITYRSADVILGSGGKL